MNYQDSKNFLEGALLPHTQRLVSAENDNWNYSKLLKSIPEI